MTANNTTTDYSLATGGAIRKVDLYIMGSFNFADSSSQATSPSLSVETGGQVCAGIVKLAQKVISVLMSCGVYYDFDWGTKLPRVLSSGNAHTIQKNVVQFMAAFLALVLDQIQAQETNLMPDDERLFRLELRTWSYDRVADKLSVSLVMTSLSGDQLSLVVPISTVP